MCWPRPRNVDSLTPRASRTVPRQQFPRSRSSCVSWSARTTHLPRDSTIDMLRLIGHRAVGAGDARTALSILVSEPFDILLTDVGLPDMSGATLAECARSRSSKLEVVFVTGQALDPSVRTAITAQVLMKPFSLEALVGVLAAVESAGDSAATTA